MTHVWLILLFFFGDVDSYALKNDDLSSTSEENSALEISRPVQTSTYSGRKMKDMGKLGDRALSRQKRKVSKTNEMKYYQNMNELELETVRRLLPNMTEEPHVPLTPSHECCYNGGTCHVPTDRNEDRWCSCTPHFSGRYCDLDVDECLSSNACAERHQVCINNYGGYECRCASGFIQEGNECTRVVNCEDDPCQNLADCIDLENGHVLCQCRLGFTGYRCDLKIPDCEDNSCSDDETCVTTTTGFQCLRGSLKEGF